MPKQIRFCIPVFGEPERITSRTAIYIVCHSALLYKKIANRQINCRLAGKEGRLLHDKERCGMAATGTNAAIIPQV